MSEHREWIPLREAFDLVAATPEIETRARAWLEDYPKGWDINAAGVQRWLAAFVENWTIADAINLVTEEAISEGGRTAALRFRGLRGETENERSSVPAEWFEERRSGCVSLRRGVDPDSDTLTFAPLHQVQDDDFVSAVDFQVDDREPAPCWRDVLVESSTLETFLNGLAPQRDKSGGQSFDEADAVLIAEMHAMITSGAARSAIDAARQVAGRARRLGKVESVVDRLRRDYGKKHPTSKRR
jgi:hypothetical protein